MTPTITINHFPSCRPDYPEKPATEQPQQLSSMGIGDGETVFSCNDCGAFVVLDRDGKEIARS